MLIIQGFAVLAIVVLDQWVKMWVIALPPGVQIGVPGLARIVYERNYGAAFSMLPGKQIFLLTVTVLAVGLIAFLLIKRWPRHPLGSWALVLVAGGALGNFLDRLAYGYVVDMFELLFMRFAIFNVADIFVTMGGILFCVYLIFIHEKRASHVVPDPG